MERPAGITGIAVLFFVAAIYLWAIGVVKLLAPDAVSLMSGRYFMYGLELAGPYMALLVGSVYAVVGWGLWRLLNWARWAAMAMMVPGIAALVPAISAAQIGAPMLLYGLQIVLRVAVGWYLAQAPAVIDSFSKK